MKHPLVPDLDYLELLAAIAANDKTHAKEKAQKLWGRDAPQELREMSRMYAAEYRHTALTAAKDIEKEVAQHSRELTVRTPKGERDFVLKDVQSFEYDGSLLQFTLENGEKMSMRLTMGTVLGWAT